MTTINEEVKVNNQHDVEIERAKMELGKYEMDLNVKIAEWKLTQQLKHDKFMRVTTAIEKITLAGIIGGVMAYNKQQNVNLTKHRWENGGE